MTESVMTIRQMCDAYNVTPRTLRFYEAKELLFPIREGQKRLFTRKDRARLQLILRGKRFGFSLEEIRQLLDMYSTEDGGGKQLQGALKAYEARMMGLKDEAQSLRSVITELGEQIDWLQSQVGTLKT